VGLPQPNVEDVVAKKIGAKGEAAIQASVAAVRRGYALAGSVGMDATLPLAAARTQRWLISGNEAVATGALRGGVRFVAAYPITPATEMLEWMAPALPRIGGQLIQAEDELAAINLLLGASYGGVPSMTATSGPGLSLMVEALGLATAAEVPALVVDVMRGGPSTGIPTKTEQSDLNIAVYGAHGDAPRVVIAPTSIADGLPSAQWAVELGEQLQVPVILLSDQAMGQARSVIDAPPAPGGSRARSVPEDIGEGSYRRYVSTGDGVSPMARPGTPHGQWIAEGLTHNDAGTPSSAVKDHQAQMEKRLRKLMSYDFGSRWADVDGDGELAVISWGSTTGAVREAVADLCARGLRVRHIALRLIAPLQAEKLAQALAGVSRALVVELNQSGQLYRYLLGHADLPVRLERWSRLGPLPFRPGEVARHIATWSAA
jgi:2-oxoglutarate ferredoxin oxidoreductase subunit alpha